MHIQFPVEKGTFHRWHTMPPKSGAAAVKGKKKCSIPESDAKNLQKIFAEYDADGSGEISILELTHFFGKSPELYASCSCSLVSFLLSLLFAVLLLKYHFRKGNAADFIATIDKDGDGKITFLELLKELFPMTPSKQLNDIYRKFYPEALPKPIKYVFSLVMSCIQIS